MHLGSKTGGGTDCSLYPAVLALLSRPLVPCTFRTEYVIAKLPLLLVEDGSYNLAPTMHVVDFSCTIPLSFLIFVYFSLTFPLLFS